MLRTLEGIQKAFNDAQAGGKKKVSLADLIVLGGCAAVEQAAKNGGHDVQVPFTPGRTDASQEQTDVESFAVLEPTQTGSATTWARDTRCRRRICWSSGRLLTLSAPEMTVLVGGLRVLNANAGQSKLGVFTTQPGTLTNDFFVNLLDMDTEWQPTSEAAEAFEGRDRDTGEVKWTGSRVDLVFGSNSELRALAEVYACDDAQEKFVRRLRGRVGQGHESRSIRPRPDPMRPREVIADLRALAARTSDAHGAQRVAWGPVWRDARRWLDDLLAADGLRAETDRRRQQLDHACRARGRRPSSSAATSTRCPTAAGSTVRSACSRASRRCAATRARRRR